MENNLIINKYCRIIEKIHSYSNKLTTKKELISKKTYFYQKFSWRMTLYAKKKFR